MLFVGPEFVAAVTDAGPAVTVRAFGFFVFVVGVFRFGEHQKGPFMGWWVHLATVPLATFT